MKPDMPKLSDTKPVADSAESSKHPPSAGHLHTRFLMREEFDALLGDEVRAAIDAERAVMAYERHLERLERHLSNQEIALRGWPPDVSRNIPTFVPPIFRPGIGLPPGAGERIFRALSRARPNHLTMDQTARNRFNNALQMAHQAKTYQQRADIHRDMTTHRMHSSSGAEGTQRFLPWHRQYLFECEKLLRTYEPLVRIPYWDFANDHARPDWVWKPPDVDRGNPGATGSSLPNQQTVDNIERLNPTYTGFTTDLESKGHNGVHNWCNGTISFPETAAKDPIFWLLHANVDRIWDHWQLTHNGMPTLSGTDAVLDPWGPVTAIDVDSVIGLGYWYR